jgi:RNA polymerase sigma-70 factor (ECF subfamily)
VTERGAWPQSPDGGESATDRAVCQTVGSPRGEALLGGPALLEELARIYRAEFPFVWKRLRRLGVAERDLADRVHDVFVIVHAHLGRFDRSRPLRPWLAGISVRVAMKHHRAANQRRVVLQEVDRADERGGPDALLEQQETRDRVLAALDELPLEQRTVLVLKELDGFTMPEIAQMLDVPLNTLYSRLRLARQRFSSAAQQVRGPRSEP